MLNNGNTVFQQMKAYKEFVDSFRDAMKSGEGIMNSIEESTSVYQKIIGDNFKKNMQNDYKNLGNNLKDYQKFMKRYKIETEKDIEYMTVQMKKLYDNKEETDRMAQNFRVAMQDMQESSKDASENISSIFNNLAGVISALGVSQLLGQVDAKVDDLINSTNRLQRSGVGTYGNAESYRENLGSIIDELNRDTGNKYHLKDMYNDIATLAENTNIARLDTLREITRPALLAYKSMNVSLDSIAQFTGKLYEFAGIDSYKMEDILNYVHGISEGMNVDEQKLIDNMSALQDTVMFYTTSRGMDPKTIENVLKDVSDVTAILEDSGLDSTAFVSDIIEFLQNPSTSGLTHRLWMYGYDNASDLQEGILSQDGLESFLYKYMEVIAQTTNEYSSKNLLGPALDNLLGTVGTDEAIKISNAVNSGKLYESITKLEENSRNITTMEKAVEDQYVTLLQGLNNQMSTMLEVVTDIKEQLGFGFSDIMSILMVIAATKNLFGNNATGGSLKSLIGSYTGMGGTGTASGLLGMLEAGGSHLSGTAALTGKAALGMGVLGAAGITAGVGGAYYGITKGMEDIDEGNTGLGATNIAGGAAMGVGAGALAAGMLGVGATNAWNPIGWIALAAGAATLAGAAIYEAVTPVSGLSKQLSAEMEQLKNDYIDEQAARMSQIVTLKDSIKSAETDAEARKLAIESGLIPLDEATVYTKDRLLELANAAAQTTAEMTSEGIINYELSQEIIKDIASQETSQVNKQIHDTIMEWIGEDEKLTKEEDPDKFNQAYLAFKGLAESIKDDTQREDTLSMVEEIFGNGVLGDEELKVLTDMGGNLQAFISWYDRDDAYSRYAIDTTKASTSLGFIGVDGYTLSEQAKEVTTELQTLYDSWKYAMDAETKESYKKSFEESWKSLPESTRNLLRETWIDEANAMGINSFRVGTNYVTHDQVALVHEGEAIVPKEYNPAANTTELETLRNQVSSNSYRSEENVEKMLTALNSLLGKVSDILDTFNDYSDRVSKQHEESLFSSNINNTKNNLHSRLSGVYPSANKGGVYI